MLFALWSVPRSRSTAFFRMMLERGDLAVVHEPFSSRAEHGEAEVGGVRARTEHEVIAALRAAARTQHVFFKDTTDERYAAVLADRDLLARDARHAFLIRHPGETIPSYFALNPGVRSSQLGFAALYELYEAVWDASGERPLVFDSAELVERPAEIARAYCARVGLPFVGHALAWRAGERAEWRATDRWHRDVSATSGFDPSLRSHAVRIADHPHLAHYLAEQLPYYEQLRDHRYVPGE